MIVKQISLLQCLYNYDPVWSLYCPVKPVGFFMILLYFLFYEASFPISKFVLHKKAANNF